MAAHWFFRILKSEILILKFSLCICVSVAGVCSAQMTRPGPVGIPSQSLPPNLSHVGLAQKLNAQVPLDLVFRDEFGQTIRLGDYFQHGKPVILSLVYYECPMLCTETLNGLSASLRILKLDLGKDYEVVTVSFNPKETPELALAKKRSYLQRYGRADSQNGWHFLVGDEKNVHALTDAVGFYYQWDPDSQQFAHAAGIMVLTPDGHIAQYYYGVDFSPKDLRLGLVEASKGHIGSLVDQVLLYCYHYDPRTGKYGAVVINVLKLAGAATILILGSFLMFLFMHEPKKAVGT